MVLGSFRSRPVGEVRGAQGRRSALPAVGGRRSGSWWGLGPADGRGRHGAVLAAAVGALVSGAGLLPPAVAAPAATPVTKTFGVTGASEEYTVPAGAVVTITADGAGGADNSGVNCGVPGPGGTGGTGARVVTTLPVTTAATTYTVSVGGTGGAGCSVPGWPGPGAVVASLAGPEAEAKAVEARAWPSVALVGVGRPV